jgi:hypothetical protein
MSESGSLTQSARKGQLKSARGILFFVGILTVALNAFSFTQAKSSVDAEVQKLQTQGLFVDQDTINQAVKSTQLLSGVMAGVGGVFVIMACMVYQYPVPIVASALVLYIGAAAVFAVLDPTTLAQGLLIKIIIVVSLFKSLQAAIEYQKQGEFAVEPEAA